MLSSMRHGTSNLIAHLPHSSFLIWAWNLTIPESDDSFTCAPQSQPRPLAPYPELHLKKPLLTPTQALNTFLPLRLSATPVETTARAATLINPYENTALHPCYHKLDVIQEMNLDKEETFAQIYLSPRLLIVKPLRKPWTYENGAPLTIKQLVLSHNKKVTNLFSSPSTSQRLRHVFRDGNPVVAVHG
jgi:hypothetical protein